MAEAIQDPEDVLILEGFPHLDSPTGTIAVFVTNVMTKKLQLAQRQAQKPAQEQTPLVKRQQAGDPHSLPKQATPVSSPA